MNKTSLTHAATRRVFNVSMMAVIAFGVILCMSGTAAMADSAASDAYILTATTSGQGTISPSGTVTVPEGAGRAFVFDSDENHRLVDLIVDGASIGPVAAFSFENVSASHTIEAVFESRGTLTAESEAGL